MFIRCEQMLEPRVQKLVDGLLPAILLQHELRCVVYGGAGPKSPSSSLLHLWWHLQSTQQASDDKEGEYEVTNSIVSMLRLEGM
jgi:hypothetical protein